MKSSSEPGQLRAAQVFLHGPLAASQAAVKPVAPIETLIAAYRGALPWLSGLALLGWLVTTPWPRRRVGERHARLWWVAGVLLVLVLGRLALLALIHVTSWPAANDIRYLSAAQPLLVLFTAIGLLLLTGWGTRWGKGDERKGNLRKD